MKKTSVFLFALMFFVCLGIIVKMGGAKTSSVPNPQNMKIHVTTSFYPLYFFVSQIGGDKVAVTNITPSSAEPHDYEPTTQDMVKIEESDLLILNGGVEAWGNKVQDTLKNKRIRIVIAGDGLLNQQLTENNQTSTDPHVWLDPQLAKKEVDTISKALVKIDPTDHGYFEANTIALDMRLDQLDQQYRHDLASCKQKDIITSHAAFGYLATAYGLHQIPIAGLSPDEEPSPKQLADVVDFARSHDVTYIFFESLVSPKLSDAIASEIGAKTLVLDPLEGISDADIAKGKDYFIVMQDNLKNLQMALQCTK